MTEPDFNRVAAVFTAFANSTDLYEAQQLVTAEGAILFSEPTEQYVAALTARFADDPRLLAGIQSRWKLLQSCRSEGLCVAFANFFADLYSEPVSDTAVAALLRYMNAPAELEQLLARQPALLPEVQRVSAAARFISTLTGEMQTPEALSNPARRVLLGRTALRLVERRLDPYMWAAITGELANALTIGNVTADLDEGIALYRSILPLYADGGADVRGLYGSSLHNLGQALGKRKVGADNEELKEAVRYLEQASALRPRATSPLEWAQTHYALSLVRRRWQGADRTRQVEMALHHLEQALEEWRPESSNDAWILATRDLADLLIGRDSGPRRENLERAIAALQLAIAKAPQDANETVASLQAHLEFAYQQLAAEKVGAEAGPRDEILLFGPLEGWECCKRVETAGYRVEEWVLERDTLNDWRELVTTDVRSGAGAMPFRGLLVATERWLQDRVTTGRFDFRLVEGSDDSLIYLWSVEDDFAIEDQYELVRIERGEDGLHRLHRAVRGRRFSTDGDDVAHWTQRLKNAVLSRRAGPPPLVRPEGQRATPEEIQERIAQLSAASASPVDDPERYLRNVLSGVSRGDDPVMYATLNLLGALKLLQSEREPSSAQIEAAKRSFRHETRTPEERQRISYLVMGLGMRAAPESLEQAIRALRSSLEVFSRATHPQQWATCMSNLARVFLVREASERESNTASARFGAEQAAAVFGALKMEEQLADIHQDLGRIHRRLGATGGDEEYLRALKYFSTASQFQSRETYPLEWAAARLNIAEIYETLAEGRDGEPELVAAAEKEYDSVVQCLLSDNRLSSDPKGQATAFLAVAVKALERLDRARIPKPHTPPGFEGRETRGKVLFLRPLISARTLLLQNRFRDPRSFAVQFDVEPATLPLESALHRVLLEHVGFNAVGGSPEGFGGTRWYGIGIGEGWKDMVNLMMTSANVILMVPHDSSGVRWEVEQLKTTKALARTVFIMPPASPGLDVAALWSEASPFMHDLGLELPPYRDDGLFLRFGEEGRIVETFPFDTIWDNTLFQRLEPLLPVPGPREVA